MNTQQFIYYENGKAGISRVTVNHVLGHEVSTETILVLKLYLPLSLCQAF
jgi:hypothetical protein